MTVIFNKFGHLKAEKVLTVYQVYAENLRTEFSQGKQFGYNLKYIYLFTSMHGNWLPENFLVRVICLKLLFKFKAVFMK